MLDETSHDLAKTLIFVSSCLSSACLCELIESMLGSVHVVSLCLVSVIWECLCITLVLLRFLSILFAIRSCFQFGHVFKTSDIVMTLVFSVAMTRAGLAYPGRQPRQNSSSS